VRFGWIRLHYLLLYAVVGAYMPYLPVFLGSDLHLPDWQIGWVTGIYGLSVLVAPPIVTSLADRSVSGRTIIGCAYVLACLGLIALALVDSFLAVLPLAFAFSLVYTPLFALLDGLAFSAIAAAERSPPYDRLRVWGSLGFMVPAFVLFFALHAGVAGRTAIVAAAVAAGLGALASPLLPNFPPAARASGLPPFAAWQALRGASTRALLIPVGLLFAAISVFYAFYGRLLISVGIDAAWIGLVMNIGVLAELPLMFAAGALLRRFSVRAILLTSAACLTARMALLATSGSLVVVVTQVLHGPVVLGLYLLPPMILNLKAEPRLRNGVQGLYAMLCFGLARLVGSVLGGYAAEIELRWAFVLGAALAFVALAWLVIAFDDPEIDVALRKSNPAHG
jgi:PPP family 3-phenylpropionic acid transporter